MPLSIHTSNRLEILAQLLAQHVSRPLKSPLAPEIIVVQSRGMERWISLELARYNGISANCRFPFPDAFFSELAAAVNPELTNDNPYDIDAMTFRIMKWLPSLLHRPEFTPVKRYLHKDPLKVKQYQLSVNIADLFDQYLMFRPEMMLDWEKAVPTSLAENRWQVTLWRKLTREIDVPHRARLQRMTIDKIPRLARSKDILPERVALFAMTYMSPFHFNTLTALGQVIPVTIYFQNPCREYWADILTHSEAQRIKSTHRYQDQPEAMLHLDRGNPLLASMGSVGQDFFKRILETDGEIFEHFEDIAAHSLLTQVQSDILNLTDPTSPTESRLENFWRPHGWDTDTSIQIKNCHSATRELEVLYDFILDKLDQNETMSPSDIVVMAPDIDAYAPFIHAVFDGAKLKISYAIADRIIGQTSHVIDGFFSLLDLYQSRLSVPDILALLDIPGVRERFQLTEANIADVTRWLNDINVRWGVDAAHKSKLGLFGSSAHTWKAGIQQLLLGYAMSADPQRLFSGVLPYEGIVSSSAPVLGRFLDFVDVVTEFAENLAQPKSLENWHIFFSDTLNEFFQLSDDEEPQMQMLRQLLEKFRLIEDSVGYRSLLDCRVVRLLLTRRLIQTYKAGGYLTGGVTFCAMLPMRSIPFKVVCLLGLNHDEFPRESRTLEFDYIRRAPRPGDRSRRNDDKYMFIETILSARQTFYVSYIGQDEQDNSLKPPSVVVSDLLDYLNRGYGVKEDSLVTRHRLQAFSPDYFNGSDLSLFSYSVDNLKASQALVNVNSAVGPFVPSPLPEPNNEFKSLDLDQLCHFYFNPARYLLQHRLGVYLHEHQVLVSDVESFSIDGLDRYYLAQDQYRLLSSAQSRDDIYRIQKARGRLPEGSIGVYHYDQMSSAVGLFIDRVNEFLGEMSVDENSFDIRIDDFAVTGQLAGITAQGYLRIRYARQTVRDILAAWLHHLAFCITAGTAQSQITTLVNSDATIRFERPSDPHSLLKNLLEIYWEGLRSPLPFFPEASTVFVHHLHKRGESPDKALKAAIKKWMGNEYVRGEKNDEYSSICFDLNDLLDERFQTIAATIISPILDHSVEMTLEEVNWPVR